MINEFTKWPKIGAFKDTAYNLKSERTEEWLEPALSGQVLQFRPKVKLHGTNCAVRVFDGGVSITAQSRGRDLTIYSDNYGFCQWVESSRDYWSQVGQNEDLIVYGEWCGKGIQQSTACSQTQGKWMAVFAIATSEELIVCPDKISKILGKNGECTHIILPDLFNIPWAGEPICLNVTDVQSFVDQINEHTDSVCKEDPFMKDIFDQTGYGEGLVYYPYNISYKGTWKPLTDLAFKSKGELFKEVKGQKAAKASYVQIDYSGVEELAAAYVTDERCQKALKEVEFSGPKEIGLFIRYMQKDIEEEAKTEIISQKMDPKNLMKCVATLSRKWLVFTGNLTK